MRKRYAFAALPLLLLLTLVVWQVSFSFGGYGPADATQTFLFWAVSTLIFILTVWLLARLVKISVRLYLERQSGREGSRIKSKLVFGALALSLLREGATTSEVAGHFDVSRQRVSHLVRDHSAPGRRP